MITFSRIERIASDFGQWHALVVITKDGVEQAHFLRFDREPSAAQAEKAGKDHALRLNLAEAPNVSLTVVAREDFFARFTNKEISKIYRASNTNDDVLAFVKRLEMQPTLRLNHPDVTAGLQLLEAGGLLAVGRAAEILG